MKIGVVTFHHAKHSYGASLQAFATVRVLRNMGYDVELISYENAYEQASIKDHGVSVKKKFILYLNKMARMYLYNGRKDPYLKSENLDHIYGCVTNKVYSNVAQMQGLYYDVLLVGSDQVWNPEVTGYLDDVFLLMFGKAKRRVSYASSMGSHRLNGYERSLFKKGLDMFTSISVREAYAKEQLQPLVDRNIKVVADPTLLMTKEEWRNEFAINENSERGSQPYILTYFVGGNLTSYWNDVKKYVDELKLPLWNIQSHSKKRGNVDRVIYAATLDEILSLLSNAALIITDSFHGTAFSINFQRQFVALLNKKNPVRVIDLLKSVGLSNRINIDTKHVMDNINFEEVTEQLASIRDDSIQWLKNAVES